MNSNNFVILDETAQVLNNISMGLTVELPGDDDREDPPLYASMNVYDGCFNWEDNVNIYLEGTLVEDSGAKDGKNLTDVEKAMIGRRIVLHFDVTKLAKLIDRAMDK